MPGDTLWNYFGPGPSIDTSHVEVHGNQYGLLAESKCFKISGTMECRTCHAPHQQEENDLAAFSQRCMTCHQSSAMVKPHKNAGYIPNDVGDITKTAGDVTRNCIDCHMPVQASSIVTLMVPGKKQLAPLFVRNHRIAVYKRLDQFEDKIQRH